MRPAVRNQTSAPTLAAVAAAASSYLPGSLAPLGRQETIPSVSAALPSFAELAASAGGNAALATPHMWRQESARAAMPTTAPIALDLDLESSDSEDDDD